MFTNIIYHTELKTFAIELFRNGQDAMFDKCVDVLFAATPEQCKKEAFDAWGI
jgi:hypothetical protein